VGEDLFITIFNFHGFKTWVKISSVLFLISTAFKPWVNQTHSLQGFSPSSQKLWWLRSL